MVKSEDKIVQPTLLQLAEKSAKRGLVALAIRSMDDYRHEQFKNRYAHSQGGQAFGSPVVSLKAAVSGLRSEGLFFGLDLDEIFSLCFRAEAIDFICQNSYNDYLFWSNVNTVVASSQLDQADQISFPYTIEYVRQRLFFDLGPFGYSSASPLHWAHVARLAAE